MTREEKQRIYDAMLIRAWRKDVTLNELRYWLKPYDLCITDPDLIRTKKFTGLRVRVFVGAELKPLADKLFDHEPVDDIKILNWLGKSGLRCQNTDNVMHKDIRDSAYRVSKERKINLYIRETYANDKNGMTPKTKVRSLSARHR